MSDKNNKPEKSAAEAPDKLTMNYVLEQIERISKDTEYLYNTIQKLGEISHEGMPGEGRNARKCSGMPRDNQPAAS